jgi:hypothetical protein
MREKEPQGPAAETSPRRRSAPFDRPPRRDPECVVVVLDHERARLQFIHGLVDSCEVRARRIDDSAAAAAGDGGVAFVALTAGPAHEESTRAPSTA